MHSRKFKETFAQFFSREGNFTICYSLLCLKKIGSTKKFIIRKSI